MSTLVCHDTQSDKAAQLDNNQNSKTSQMFVTINTLVSIGEKEQSFPIKFSISTKSTIRELIARSIDILIKIALNSSMRTISRCLYYTSSHLLMTTSWSRVRRTDVPNWTIRRFIINQCCVRRRRRTFLCCSKRRTCNWTHRHRDEELGPVGA